MDDSKNLDDLGEKWMILKIGSTGWSITTTATFPPPGVSSRHVV